MKKKLVLVAALPHRTGSRRFANKCSRVAVLATVTDTDTKATNTAPAQSGGGGIGGVAGGAISDAVKQLLINQATALLQQSSDRSGTSITQQNGVPIDRQYLEETSWYENIQPNDGLASHTKIWRYGETYFRAYDERIGEDTSASESEEKDYEYPHFDFQNGITQYGNSFEYPPPPRRLIRRDRTMGGRPIKLNLVIPIQPAISASMNPKTPRLTTSLSPIT